MRHQHGYRKLGRESSHRRAMMRNMASSFLAHGKIKTTVPKAKELRRVVERMITLGKKSNLHARRQVEEYLFDSAAAKKVFTDYAGRFESRPGGYTRIVRLGERFGDGADMCQLELVDYRDHEGAAKSEG